MAYTNWNTNTDQWMENHKKPQARAVLSQRIHWVQDKTLFTTRSRSDGRSSLHYYRSLIAVLRCTLDLLFFLLLPHSTPFPSLSSVKYEVPAGTNTTVTATSSPITWAAVQDLIFIYFDILRPSIFQERDGAWVLKPATWPFKILKSHHYSHSPKAQIFCYIVLHFIWSLLHLLYF